MASFDDQWEAELRRQLQQRRPRAEPEDPNWDQPDSKRQMIEKIKREPALITKLPLDVAAIILGDLSFFEINELGQTSPEISTYINNNLLWHKIYGRKYLPRDLELFAVTPDLRAWFDRRGGVQWRWLCYIADKKLSDPGLLWGMAMHLYEDDAEQIIEDDVLMTDLGGGMGRGHTIILPLHVWTEQDGSTSISHSEASGYSLFIDSLYRQVGGHPSDEEQVYSLPGPRGDSYRRAVRLICMLFYTGWRIHFRDDRSGGEYLLRSQINCVACDQPNAQFKEQGTGRVFCGTKCQKKLY